MPIRWQDEQQQAPVGTLEDVGRSAAAGAGRGVASVPGLPGDAAELAQIGLDWLAGKITGRTPEEQAAFSRSQIEAGGMDPKALPSTQDIVDWGAQAMPFLGYEPQTRAGKFARAAAEGAAGAALLPGGGARATAALAYGAIPGVASEAAGQATKGTSLEAPARVAAGLLAAGAGGRALMPGTPGQAIREATEGVTPQQFDAAEQLFMEAQRQGIPISRAQALQQVTGGQARQLGNIQRVVEGGGGMDAFYSRTGPAVREAGEQMLDRIGPAPRHPLAVGEAAAPAAQGSLDRTQARINTITRPAYQSAANDVMPSSEMARLAQDPIYQRGVAAVRQNPNLARQVENLPDDSVVFNDYVQRYLRETTDPAAAGQAGMVNMERTNITTTADDVRRTSAAASPALEVARSEQARLRERYLQPLLTGPLGRIAERPETQAAIDALFPKAGVQPAPGDITRAVSGMRASGPAGERAARDLVRTYLKTEFDAATRDLQGGQNQWGGATFRAAVAGNEQRRQNLEAAIRALPNGEAQWTGVSRFLDLMEAVGQRQRIGSQTAFNQELQDQMRRGGVLSDVAATTAGAWWTLPRRARDTIQRWNMGRNAEELAQLFTDPRAGARFQRLGTMRDPFSEEARNIVLSLTGVAQRSVNNPDEREERQERRVRWSNE